MRKLKCIDCGAEVEGDTERVIELMRHHVEAAHERELAFLPNFYRKPRLTSEDVIASQGLLYPELSMSA